MRTAISLEVHLLEYFLISLEGVDHVIPCLWVNYLYYPPPGFGFMGNSPRLFFPVGKELQEGWHTNLKSIPHVPNGLPVVEFSQEQPRLHCGAF